jgi:glycosyltransferase involved in cell wall biosynthesis
MKRVLFLSYFFPPIGGGGVGRSVNLVRYLPRLGYEPVVVTGPGGSNGRWTPVDEMRAAQVPAEIEVRRIRSEAPPLVGAGWHGRAERWLGFPRAFERWWTAGAYDRGRSVDDVDLIYASMAPYESASVAMTLSRELDKPWVADLRDPWALDEITIYPTRFHRRHARTKMRRALASASAIVTTTNEASRRIVDAFPELRRKRIVTIPIGFDPANFAGEPPTRTDGKFRIVHAGALHTDLGLRHERLKWMRSLLGGAIPVDILPRSHVFLLDAVDRLLVANPDLRDVIDIYLAGVVTGGDVEVASQSPVVRVTGYLPHAEAVDLLRSADLLFLPMHDLPAGMRATIVPGKTYEYLGAGRPILAAVPDGDARDILAEAGNAMLCRPRDVAAMAQAIERELVRWRAGSQSSGPRPELVEQFEYGRLSGYLAELFGEIAPGPRLARTDSVG